MYTDFFQLKEEPFQVTPNPKFLFLSNIHKEAIRKLIDGIRRRKGFIELVGIAGTGKTLLCKELVQMLSPEMEIAYLYYPVLNEQALYYAILKQWGVSVSEETPVPALLEKISHFLRERFERGRNALIILDEAQNLSVSLLENLRLLSNLETESEKLLQILLSGQPEFHELLKSGKIPQLDQRIRVRVFLKPLDREVLPLYIYHRLNMAGTGNTVTFTGEAFDLIYRASGGIPRLVNAMCERSLEEAADRRSTEIDAAIVRSAREGLEGGHDLPIGKVPAVLRGQKALKWGLTLALTSVLVGGGIWLGRSHTRTPAPAEKVAARRRAPVEEHPRKTLSASPKSSTNAIKFSASYRLLPLRVMKNFLEGLLAIPEGRRLYWGMLRLGERDLRKLTTPFLLHIAPAEGKNGWICVRRAGRKGLQIWYQGKWLPLRASLSASWTGRCAVPFWLPSPPGDTRALRKGMRGEAVSELQKWLKGVGGLDEVTGDFDGLTERAVRDFQLREGLTPDGVAGTQTLALLFQKGNRNNDATGEK